MTVVNANFRVVMDLVVGLNCFATKVKPAEAATERAGVVWDGNRAH